MSLPNSQDRPTEGMLNLPWMTANQKEATLYRSAFGALTALGVPMNLHGFDYLISAIMLVADDPSEIRRVTNGLYKKIAESYGTKWYCVERNIRTAIENTFLNKDLDVLHSCFGNMINETSGKVKNSVFIRKVASDVRFEVMSSSTEDMRRRVLSELGIEPQKDAKQKD